MYSNIQPRLGFAYEVNPGTVFRAGAGRYVLRIVISDNVQVGGNAPFQPSSTVTRGSVDNPGVIGTNSSPVALTSQRYNYPSPEAWGWHFTFEHDFPELATFILSYVGRRGIHEELLSNINQLQPGTTQPNPTIINANALRPYRAIQLFSKRQMPAAPITTPYRSISRGVSPKAFFLVSPIPGPRAWTMAHQAAAMFQTPAT